MILVKVSLELKVAHFISRLKFTVVFRLFLNSIVGEMNELILKVVDVELSARGAQVSLFVKVCFVITVDACDHCIRADVKLTAVYKQRIIDVLLHDTCPLFRPCALRYNSFYFVKILSHLDSLTPICVFARFYDPDVCLRFFTNSFVISLEFVELWII